MRGFTFFETMIVLTLVAIISLVGIMQFSSINNDAQDTSAIQLFRTDMQRAKAEAAARGGRMIVKASSTNTSYSAGIDYPPYSGTLTADTNVFTRNLPLHMTVSFSSTLIFDPRGFLIDANGNMTTGSATLLRNGSGVRAFAIDTLGGVS